ncbi:fumarylacetoacetate hydrolase family protein [Falsibacillus pallidus]|uniref:fumarylacetoacetate hydrolase family protein n=1 Tax=Falsibacillus pallidus TaxID=493781 RepID=UPI003D95D959
MTSISARLSGFEQKVEGTVDHHHDKVSIDGIDYKVEDLAFTSPVRGTIYGTLLNYKGALKGLGDQVNHPPYKEAPKAPILYIKPYNTISSHKRPIFLPEGIEELEMGAALGIVFGKEAVNVSEAYALEYVEGYTVVNDVSIPHESVYRPPVKYKCRDGYCPTGPWVVDREGINPDSLSIQVYINGKLVQENHTSNLIRSIPRLIADVTKFMTLYPGDMLLAGIPEGAPKAKNGDSVRINIESIGSLENTIMREMTRRDG